MTLIPAFNGGIVESSEVRMRARTHAHAEREKERQSERKGERERESFPLSLEFLRFDFKLEEKFLLQRQLIDKSSGYLGISAL